MKKLAILLVAAGCASFALFEVHAQDAPPPALSPAETAQAIKDFNGTCAACHGDNAGGGDRAPALTDNAHLRTLDVGGHRGHHQGWPAGHAAFPESAAGRGHAAGQPGFIP